MDFDTLRQRAEAFLQKLYRALYQRHTGQLADIPVREVYAAPGIFTREAILSLREWLTVAKAEERQRLELVFNFLIEGYLRLQAADLDEELAKQYDALTQSGAWARHDAFTAGQGDGSFGGPATEATSRSADSSEHREQLLSLYHERWQTVHSSLQQVGLDLVTYLGLTAGSDPEQLAAQATDYLAATGAEYATRLARYSQGGSNSRNDLERLIAAPQFVGSFPEAEHVPTVEDTLYHLGIDVTRQPNLALEINRSLRPGSAMAFPVRVPEEIYLVVSPAAGLNAYEQFLRVTGMIMPKLLLSPKRPWAERRLSPYSLAEAYGELFAGLLCNSTWLVDLLNFDEVIGEFVDSYRFRRLYHLRRAAARLIHLTNCARGEGDYATTFGLALGVPHQEEDLWQDMGWQRRAIPTWQGLQQGLALEATLLKQYGPGWYRDQTASARLRELWTSGEADLTFF